eukprot:TCALIF_12383-PA protein Name:"Similar to PGAM2 Phosphoglycerate mutase 2 (Bos taurus)" AED:0.61 eAED:0.61 QI:0/0/0/0.66/1/1/3/0/176
MDLPLNILALGLGGPLISQAGICSSMIAHYVTLTLDVPEPDAAGHEFVDAPVASSAAPPHSLVAPWMHGAMPDWLRDTCKDVNKLSSVVNWGYKAPLQSSKTYQVVMIRHGESEWNKENRFCGWFDAGLSAKEQLGQNELRVEKTWRLNERHYGGLTGLNKAETAEIHGEDQVQVS